MGRDVTKTYRLSRTRRDEAYNRKVGALILSVHEFESLCKNQNPLKNKSYVSFLSLSVGERPLVKGQYRAAGAPIQTDCSNKD